MASIDKTPYDERVFLDGSFTGKDLFDIGYTADDMEDLCHFHLRKPRFPYDPSCAAGTSPARLVNRKNTCAFFLEYCRTCVRRFIFLQVCRQTNLKKTQRKFTLPTQNKPEDNENTWSRLRGKISQTPTATARDKTYLSCSLKIHPFGVIVRI